MVENSHVDQRQRLFEALREQFVGTARFRYSEGWLCANMTAAAFHANVAFTTSRG